MKIRERYPRVARCMKRWLPLVLVAAVPATIFAWGQASANNYGQSTSLSGAVASSETLQSENEGTGPGLSQDRGERPRLDDLVPDRNNHELSFTADPHLEIPTNVFGDLKCGLFPTGRDRGCGELGLQIVGMRWRIRHTNGHTLDVAPGERLRLAEVPGQLGHYPDLAVHNPHWLLKDDHPPVIHVDTLKCSLGNLLRPTYHFDGKLGDSTGSTASAASHWMILTIVRFDLDRSAESSMDPGRLSDQNLCLELKARPAEAPSGGPPPL